ncbi:hypothetical protein P154DRAFT_12478 [Amniculicola lignicola CBS 123094]|uniref:Uncharacterized protein n=1 Tax=Amniculicola lignicola CBS 123094 TaxID=1392246 RepID=A0A6A5X534_9PLEO|nr:hypothetical protein P154DRAFT_12478 [Amniculicola lignicola CBS 123094]
MSLTLGYPPTTSQLLANPRNQNIRLHSLRSRLTRARPHLASRTRPPVVPLPSSMFIVQDHFGRTTAFGSESTTLRKGFLESRRPFNLFLILSCHSLILRACDIYVQPLPRGLFVTSSRSLFYYLYLSYCRIRIRYHYFHLL